MYRRRLLSLGGTAGIASLAGCQTLGGALRREPPRFEDVELSGPSEATVGDSVSLSVTVTNAGGQQGGFADSLTAEGGVDAETAVRVEAVAPSESRTVEVGPFTLGYAGDHRFELADAGASHVVSTSPSALRADESFVSPGGPEVTVAEATTHASLFYDAPDRRGEEDGRSSGGRDVVSPGEDSVLVVVRVSVTNRGQQSVPVGPSSFDATDGEVLADLDGDAPLAAVSGPDGDPFPDGSIPAGETRSGWLLVAVARERAASGLEVAWHRPRDGRGDESAASETEATATGEMETTSESERETTAEDERETTSDGETATPPEARWRFDPVEPPTFEVSDLTLRGGTELGSSVSASATVRNAGSEASTYRGVLERRDADGGDWERLGTFERELSPGGSATVRTPARSATLGQTAYRLRPGDATETVAVGPAERALGEQFTTPEGAGIRVDVGTDDFDGLFTTYIYEDDEFNSVRSMRGHTFAFVHVTVENTASESLGLPEPAAFSLVADGERYSPYHSSPGQRVFLRSPIEGPFYAPPSETAPGETTAGWVLYHVPEDVTVPDLTVRWSPTDAVGATWSAEP